MSRARTFADLATASEGDSLHSPNMIVNGDMSVAQRGTSSTGQSSSGYKVIDLPQEFYQLIAKLISSQLALGDDFFTNNQF